MLQADRREGFCHLDSRNDPSPFRGTNQQLTAAATYFQHPAPRTEDAFGRAREPLANGNLGSHFVVAKIVFSGVIKIWIVEW